MFAEAQSTSQSISQSLVWPRVNDHQVQTCSVMGSEDSRCTITTGQRVAHLSIGMPQTIITIYQAKLRNLTRDSTHLVSSICQIQQNRGLCAAATTSNDPACHFASAWNSTVWFLEGLWCK